jgi:hypothetical protein
MVPYYQYNDWVMKKLHFYQMILKILHANFLNRRQIQKKLYGWQACFLPLSLFKPAGFHRESAHGKVTKTLVWAENQERVSGPRL